VRSDEPRPVAVALGSNLGDRGAHLRGACDRLQAFLGHLVVSPFIDTVPEDVPPQPIFLNAAALGWSAASVRELLDRLLAIEHAAGRTRPHPGAPRTLDLDLILVGGIVVDEPGVQVPHPRFRERAFVLGPLAEIAPNLRDPVTGLTVRELLARLQARAGAVRSGRPGL